MYYYSLRISTVDLVQTRQIDEFLGVRSNYSKEDWGLEIIQKEGDPPFHFIDYFISLLDGKYEKLASINIFRNEITIWMLYEYEGQCNIELSSDEMKKLGENEIAFCISCWEKTS